MLRNKVNEGAEWARVGPTDPTYSDIRGGGSRGIEAILSARIENGRIQMGGVSSRIQTARGEAGSTEPRLIHSVDAPRHCQALSAVVQRMRPSEDDGLPAFFAVVWQHEARSVLALQQRFASLAPRARSRSLTVFHPPAFSGALGFSA